jgi:uncharacterized protein YqeY
MSLIEKLKKESMRLRKERSPVSASIQFALSEIEKVGKNAGNRATTDDEAIRVIQKIIATIDENLRHADDGRAVHLNYEKKILESVLPQMATDQEVVDFLRDQLSFKTKETMPKKGEIMQALRSHFGSLVDMKRAGELLKDIYGI